MMRIPTTDPQRDHPEEFCPRTGRSVALKLRVPQVHMRRKIRSQPTMGLHLLMSPKMVLHQLARAPTQGVTSPEAAQLLMEGKGECKGHGPLSGPEA